MQKGNEVIVESWVEGKVDGSEICKKYTLWSKATELKIKLCNFKKLFDFNGWEGISPQVCQKSQQKWTSYLIQFSPTENRLHFLYLNNSYIRNDGKFFYHLYRLLPLILIYFTSYSLLSPFLGHNLFFPFILVSIVLSILSHWFSYSKTSFETIYNFRRNLNVLMRITEAKILICLTNLNNLTICS